MNFIYFNVLLLLSGFFGAFIFSIVLMAFIAPMLGLAKLKNPPRIANFFFTGLGVVYQIYFWGLWGAFCVTMTLRFSQNPTVSWHWLYWIAGFIWCASLTGWMAHKEMQGNQSLVERRGIEKGTTLYSFITIAAFLAFAFIPSLMVTPYGWVLEPLGLHKYIGTKIMAGSIKDEKTDRTIDAFFKGYEYSISANKLGRAIPESKDPQGDFEKVKTLLKTSGERFSECDTALLNKIYVGWGDIVADKFIPGTDLLLRGMQANGDRNDLVRADALFADANNWLESNWDKLGVKLNELYGIGIKK